jgi:hypothetical protein
LYWDFHTKEKQTIYNTFFQNSRCQGIVVSGIGPWAKAVTVTWNNFITAVMYLHKDKRNETVTHDFNQLMQLHHCYIKS